MACFCKALNQTGLPVEAFRAGGTKFFILTIVWCCIHFPGAVTAQEKDIKFYHLTVQEGLPSNTVNGMIRDSRGFVWIATENGVSRYDGYTFTNFRSHENDTISIGSNITYTVFEDRQHRLWVGSEKGLDLFNRDLDRFDRHYFKNTPVRAIYQDKNNTVWIGSDHGLYQYNEQEKTLSQSFTLLFDPHQITYNAITAITEDHHGNLWVGTSSTGICVYDFKTKTFRYFVQDEKKRGSLSSNHVRKIIKDPHDRMWIATYGGGVNVFREEAETFKAYIHDPHRPASGIASNLIPTLWADEAGKIWIGTDGGGLEILDPENDHIQHVVHSAYNSKSLNNNVVRSINTDGRGGIWIGTYAGGVNFFNQNTEAFFHYKMQTFNGNSSVTSFTEDKQGGLWIGTDGGGLCYFNRSTGKFLNLHHDEKSANSLSDNRVLSLLLDHNGRLWVGTYFGGLCRYDPKTNNFTRYKEEARSEEQGVRSEKSEVRSQKPARWHTPFRGPGGSGGLSDNVVWTLLEDSKKRIWAGTNKGLNRYDPVHDAFYQVNVDNSNLSNNTVRSMLEDHKNRLWVGTQDGLNMLNEDSTRFIVFKHDAANKKSLSHDWIRTIHEDNYGNIWTGTFEGGLNVFDEATRSFQSFSESDGLPDNMISGILDAHNVLWVSTGRGLARLDMATKKIRNYYANDGLQDNQFNINACFRTEKGEFLFGGINGITLFVFNKNKEIDTNRFPPGVVLTGFKVFNREALPGQEGSPLTKHISETKSITLSYDQHVLTFEFSALNFIQPENNQYAYRLVGFESDWNYIGDKRSATYTNLDPGEYIFQAKASNNAGVWNEEGVSVSLIILPPFWETWWFYAVVTALLLLTGMLVFVIIRNRVREKIRINRLIAELELKALITQMNPHFIFNCLTSIEELVMMKKQPEAMHYLNQFSRLLRTVLQSSEKNFIALEQEITLLESYLELEAMRFDKQFQYKITMDDRIDPEEIVIPPFLTQPFVENALWHGLMHKKGERTLSVSFMLELEDILVCNITDNGIGREQAGQIKKNLKSHQSMGIKIIKERMKLMKEQNDAVDLRIIDNFDAQGSAHGTTVIIRLPVSGKTTVSIHTENRMKQVN
jgi:two-component system sensor histidine kinase ChiS